MKFLSARHSSGYKNRNWNTTSHYSLFSLDFISRFALWSQHFSLWRGNSFPLCTWKESQKSIWKCFISRSCWELGLAGCDWGMQQLTFFLDSRDLICVTWCYHTFILLFILRAVWTPPLSYPPQLKLHPDLLASALLNHKMEINMRRKLGGYKRTSILSTISFDQADVAIISCTVSIFNLGCFGRVGCSASCTWCSSESTDARLLLKSYPVSPADLWCERTAKRGWMSVGLMLWRYDWFLYTPGQDKIPNEIGFWWQRFFPIPQLLD